MGATLVPKRREKSYESSRLVLLGLLCQKGMKNESQSAFVPFTEIKFSMKCSHSVIVTNSALQKYDCFNTATDALQI